METARQKLQDLMEKYVPHEAVHYCCALWDRHPFGLKVTKKRNSKLGDYRFERLSGGHFITVNHNLNRYAFLITYIHEVAHLTVTVSHKRPVAPHGPEWKSEFIRLMKPMMNRSVFPAELMVAVQKHMRNPKASSHSDPTLVAALQKYDKTPEGLVFLDAINPGDMFIFQGQPYEKIATRRTRVLCHQMATGKKYLIPKVSLVRVHNLD